MSEKHLCAGDAGQDLVSYHLRSMRLPCGFVNAEDIDIVVRVNGLWKTISVKASNCLYFTPYSHQKPFNESGVDGFAFVYLPDPYPYYLAIQAVGSTAAFAKHAFSRRGRDDSFKDMLRRWEITLPDENPLPLLEAVA